MNRKETREVSEVREIGVNGITDTMRNENDDADAAAKYGNNNKNFEFDLDFQIEKYHFGSCKEKLRSLFDQVLVAFLRDECASKLIRPIPALCSNGRPVDLYKLFWLVRKLGGYETVSRNNLWGFVCEECGLGLGVIASTKLIYMKYLNDLDQWLRKVFSKRILENDYNGFVQKLDSLSWELEIRFRGLLPNGQKQEERDKYSTEDVNLDISDQSQLSSGRLGQDIISNNEDNGDIVASAAKILEKVIDKIFNCEESNTAAAADDTGRIPVEDKNVACISAKKVAKKFIKETLDHSEKVINNEERFGGPHSHDNVVTPGNVLESRKRKREFRSFSETLSWLIHVAKHSDDPSVGLIPDCSKWNDDGNGELWAHALQVREALLVKRHANKTAAEVLSKDQQKKPRMHPSMYEDDIPDHQSTEKLRFSKRIPSSTKHHLCPCCNSRAAPENKEMIQPDVVSLKASTKTVVKDVESLPSKNNDQKSPAVQVEKTVLVGPHFQAVVPEWTGLPSESDPKWLGTTVWPPEDGKGNSMDPIRTKTRHFCNCPFPDSVECVRFHITENRLKLKQEIGYRLFYHWQFTRMGEEVSLSWTEEEEQIFKDNMRTYSAFPNKFWNNSWKFLPSKTREKLVSYYFNVYLIQRRSYQNRVTPEDVDSDDDEKKCGAIGGRFGHNALIVPGSSSILCVLNEQSNELV